MLLHIPPRPVELVSYVTQVGPFFAPNRQMRRRNEVLDRQMSGKFETYGKFPSTSQLGRFALNFRAFLIRHATGKGP